MGGRGLGVGGRGWGVGGIEGMLSFFQQKGLVCVFGVTVQCVMMSHKGDGISGCVVLDLLTL